MVALLGKSTFMGLSLKPKESSLFRRYFVLHRNHSHQGHREYLCNIGNLSDDYYGYHRHRKNRSIKAISEITVASGNKDITVNLANKGITVIKAVENNTVIETDKNSTVIKC